MANEVRLIDANELLSDAEDYAPIRGGLADLYDVKWLVDAQPTVDAVEVAEVKEFASDVAYQFGYYGQKGGRLCITAGGLSTLEQAFDILGWDDPHPVPECECEIDGCHEHATCGAPTADGYKRMCGKHCRERKEGE